MRLTWASVLAFGLSHVAANPNLQTQLRYQDLMASLGKHTDGTPIDPHAAMVHRRQNANVTAAIIKTEYAVIPIDHFGDHQGTFKNRFWASTKYYKPGGPVFIFDGGEGDASDGVEYYLESSQSFFQQMVKKFNGIGIVWEHRYYGKSFPQIPGVTPTSAESYKYLSVEQALADVPSFAWNFTRKNIQQDLTPRGTPWVFVGGSYPGIRAAYMRNMYPGTIFASYASSAPVQASVDMSFYWEPVWQGINHYGFGNCSQDVHKTILAIDDMMEDPEKAKALKVRFLGAGAETNSNAGFGDALSVMFYSWQSYGIDNKVGSIRSFCNWISTDPATGQTAPAEGWAASKGVDFTISRWVTWPEWITSVNVGVGVNCTGPAEGAAADMTIMAANSKVQASAKPLGCDLDTMSAIDPDTRSWTWQYCTQWGYLQYTNVGDHQISSKTNDQARVLQFCSTVFPDGKVSGLLPDLPAAAATNEKFGGWSIRPSQTFWTAGEFDPWRTLSPFSQMDFAPQVLATQEIPECAAAPASIVDDEQKQQQDGNEGKDGKNGDSCSSKGGDQHKYGKQRSSREGRRYRPGKRRGTKAQSKTAVQHGNATLTKRADAPPIFGMMVSEAQHCYDFRTTAPRFNAPRQVFNQALTKWLKCFQPNSQAPGTNSQLDGSVGTSPSLIRRAAYP
jgi:hypothetical protein